MGLSGSSQALVERDKGSVPAEGCRQSGGVKGSAQTSPAAGDAALAFLLSAVVVEGCQAGQSRSFFAADAAEFGHADQDRQGGAFADPGNAEHQVQAGSEIAVST
jgi:hypothetical protein